MEQPDLFKAQTTWFHVFKAMIDSGDVAKMGPGPTTVYLVLKSYTNFQDGRSFPSLPLVAEKTGFSVRQVHRHLQVLEEHGYVNKKSGRSAGQSNQYTLREKIILHGDKNEPAAVATWDYVPSLVKDATAELKNVVLKGNFDGVRLIQIQHLQINIGQQNVAPAQAINFMFTQPEFGKMDPGIRKALEDVIRAKIKSEGTAMAPVMLTEHKEQER